MHESSELGYVEGLIQRHLVDLACGRLANLHVQCLRPRDGRSVRESMLQAAERLVQRKISGCLYYPAELSPNEMDCNRKVLTAHPAAGIKVVLVDRDIEAYPQRSEFTRIGYDNRRGGTLVTSHLIATGCRRIAFVGIPSVDCGARSAGWLLQGAAPPTALKGLRT